ncbi:hypothetical protein [Corynebacterium lubricantis]|uniref:hypothetical protein n=1 Tax=Corynebacterium lubricantis TaxID=541095 RepID=UPI0014613045|nr:hypothetical protein [Corynebacterium lubricantis]
MRKKLFGMENGLKIVVASSGQRAHYIEWFQQALINQGIPGEVIAMEYRTNSLSMRVADRAVAMPAYNSAEYPKVLLDWVEAERPDLFLSLNDYELNVHSQGLGPVMKVV